MSSGAALILAAGAGSRFGSLKQLADLNGKPLLQHAIDAAAEVLPEQVYCLVGNRAAEIEAAVSNTRFIRHPQWQQGMGSSIAAGVAALAADHDWLLLMLGDQPAVTAQQLRSLLAQQARSDCVCSRYGDTRGVPALFANSWFERLTQLQGDQGARVLLRDSDAVQEVAVPAALWDVDVPADLLRHQDLS